MNTEQERADFEAWAKADGYEDFERFGEGYAHPELREAWRGYQAGRAALQSQPTEAFPCRIIEADFETGTVTLEMQGKYTVSAGQKYLCDAPLQSQDREDAQEIAATLATVLHFIPRNDEPELYADVERLCGKFGDHARRVEGET